ncbi:dynein regulatory complex subunit 4 [Channa argus]|uniref:dynein regulatory complex subunit 4 n=1 Tax=Channa argus TaxID=215402 RepID=UPI00294705CE|nr:hypothetical protein Q8A73_002450 [Channa argus]
MPPKNKGTGKKAKVKAPTLIDGLTKEEMSKEQLEAHIVRLREELDREREERNYFQLERDKVHTFLEITDRQLQEAKAEQKNIEKDIEEDEGRHQVEIKVYRQKMKHLLCEHENTISELKADALVSSKGVQEEQQRLEAELHYKMMSIMVDMQELDNENSVKELELKHAEEMMKTRDICEKQLTETKAKYEKKMTLLPQELENMRKNESREREDHWNSHITTVIENRNKAFSEAHALVECMRQDVLTSDSLKKDITHMKEEQAVKQRDLMPIMEENKRLTKQLIQIKKEIEENEKKLKYYSSKKETNEKIKEKELRDMKSQYEELAQKFSKLQLEKDKLYNTYVERTKKAPHKSDTLLERQLKALTDSIEKMEAQLHTVLSASNMDQTAIAGITDKLEENLNTSNISIKNLQFKIAQISKARKDLLQTYEAKQKALGAPVEELSAKPLESSIA